MEKNLSNQMNVIESDPNNLPQPLLINTNSGVSPLTIGRANGIVNSSVTTACWSYDNYPSLYPSLYPTYYQPRPWVSVEQAENSFIVVKDSKTYVCQNAEEIVKIISEKVE